MRPRVCFDIDQVLATGTIEEVYSDEAGWAFDKCAPIQQTVELIGALSRCGAEVYLHTARYEEDREKTELWLRAHNISYDGLSFGKPQADLYIDDKNYPSPFVPDELGQLGKILRLAEKNGRMRTRNDR